VTYLTYGDVHHRAIALGLIMSRDPATLRIGLRYRDLSRGRQEWRGKTLHDVLAIIEQLEAESERPQKQTGSALPEGAFH
jgi:hypothetical protein